jgi:hypothetical protein
VLKRLDLAGDLVTILHVNRVCIFTTAGESFRQDEQKQDAYKLHRLAASAG